jgi:hypothetical protein
MRIRRRLPPGRPARHDYDSDHFEIYHPPLVDQALADQVAFLQKHLNVRAWTSAGQRRQVPRHRARLLRRSPAELLDDFERLSREPQGLRRCFPSRLFLGDHVTHELDMVFALDLEPEVPSDALVAVLNTQVAVPNLFVPAFRTSRGLRLRATDTAWRHGERGPVVEGRDAELVSVLGNRPKVLPRLDGDGVAVLGARLSLPTRTGA